MLSQFSFIKKEYNPHFKLMKSHHHNTKLLKKVSVRRSKMNSSDTLTLINVWHPLTGHSY